MKTFPLVMGGYMFFFNKRFSLIKEGFIKGGYYSIHCILAIKFELNERCFYILGKNDI